MRPLLLALVLTAAVRAQPVATAAPRAVQRAISLDGADPSPAYPVAVGSSLAISGATVGAGGGAVVVFVVAYVLSDCSPFGCGETFPDIALPTAIAFTAGGILGSTVIVRLASDAPTVRWPWLLPDLGLELGAWRKALAGAVVGSIPGLLVATGLQDAGPGWWFAVPVAQGLGAGIALAL